jgi:hypothetical protein
MLVNRVRGPVLLFLPILGVMLVVPHLAFPPAFIAILNHLLSLCIIVSITWLFINAALIGQYLILRRFDVQVQDNLKARSVHTQLTLLVKIVLAAITVICALSFVAKTAAMPLSPLNTHPEARSEGGGLSNSASPPQLG